MRKSKHRSRSTVPALPPEVVAHIWTETSLGAAPSFAVIEKSPYRATNAALMEFVVIAIDHPHYARPRDIADALDLCNTRVARYVNATIHAARRARLTSST